VVCPQLPENPEWTVRLKSLQLRGGAVSNEVPASGAKTTNPGASKAAISFHYDLGNEFFRLFLDRECCYSCAMYEEESESLETAQERKLEYHIQQARAGGADRVLDIGCGWGACKSGW
jgi:cyclopropane fatty-acyl-phospholipid synthase-like methyltransferase